MMNPSIMEARIWEKEKTTPKRCGVHLFCLSVAENLTVALPEDQIIHIDLTQDIMGHTVPSFLAI